eukprot:3563668-Rhodomonas_salina.4
MSVPCIAEARSVVSGVGRGAGVNREATGLSERASEKRGRFSLCGQRVAMPPVGDLRPGRETAGEVGEGVTGPSSSKLECLREDRGERE